MTKKAKSVYRCVFYACIIHMSVYSGDMKRKDLIKLLTKNGFTIKTGAKHPGVYDADGKRVTTFVNGKAGQDIPKGTANAILKQCGLK